jgi:hypothetical protein
MLISKNRWFHPFIKILTLIFKNRQFIDLKILILIIKNEWFHQKILETESLDYFLKGFFMKKFGISVCAKGV